MTNAKTAQTKTAKVPYISRIGIDLLFGRYTYDLCTDNVDPSKLLILYGDNGSGKTTILKCIFHLLSPATNKGHRYALARIPFKRLSVDLGPDITVTAERSGSNLLGSFQMLLKIGGQSFSRSFEYDPATKNLTNKKADRGLFAKLQSLGLQIHFLSDERKIITDLIGPDDDEPDDDDDDPTERQKTFLVRTLRGQKLFTRTREGSSLERAMSRLVEWIRKQAITGAGAGQVNANTLYSEIVRRIVNPYHRQTKQETPQLANLIKDFREQAERSISFAQFGLSAELPADDLIRSLEQQGAAGQAVLLEQILRPFIDGFKLRLNALEPVYESVRTLVSTIDEFYREKRISFNLREGFTIVSDRGDTLAPSMLSSGEKQLLLILCNVLTSGDKTNVFIIDEPELSLNVKWQRKLVDALLDCTRNSQVQFVLATHSLELLTQHQHNVVQLRPQIIARD